jgi:hypothetical protein
MTMDRPSPDLAAVARRYWPDLLAMAILLLGACILAGRVWRFPFDDELATLRAAENSTSAAALVNFFGNGGDVHPPLSFLIFFMLHRSGWSEAGMRLCSLAMTTFSLLLFQALTLSVITRRTESDVSPATRLIAILLFGLCPLAIGQGDAIRWYPPFAALFALFIFLYVAAARPTTQLCSAIPLGLAASTNFIAVLAIGPLLIYRYFLQRVFRPKFEVLYWLIFLMFAALGIWSAYSIMTEKFTHVMGIEFGSSPLQAAAINALGFFGGDAIGLSQAWVVLPALAVAAVAVFAVVDRKQAADPMHLLLLTIAASLPMMLTGFDKPRSFLYLAPVLASIVTVYFDKQASRRVGSMALAALVLLPAIGAIANVNGGGAPFKRNAAIPYQQVLDFVRLNAQGAVLTVSTDPVVVWLLQHERDPTNNCVSRFLQNKQCFDPDRHYDTVFTILGHSNLSGYPGIMQKLQTALAAVTAGKHQVAAMSAGVDHDAAIKSRLTGVPLGGDILSIVMYR